MYVLKKKSNTFRQYKENAQKCLPPKGFFSRVSFYGGHILSLQKSTVMTHRSWISSSF